MAARPRYLTIGIFRFLLVGLLTSALLLGATVGSAHLMAWWWDEEWSNPQFLIVGIMCGLIAWLFVTVFHLGRETQTVPFSQREQFLAKMKAVLHEMGYAISAQRADAMTFRPQFHSYLFGGSIHVALAEQEAKLTGPKVSLEIFRRGFRLHNHVQRVHLYLHDQRKITENVIKRAELRLRLRPAQFEAVRKNIIELLEKDADVACELNLFLQSDVGLRDELLEVQVRPWLEKHGIALEIKKGLVQFVEVGHAELEPETVSP